MRSPLILSTRYSWLGEMSRYCTMALSVGMADAFTTAACFRLLILASGGRARETQGGAEEEGRLCLSYVWISIQNDSVMTRLLMDHFVREPRQINTQFVN